MCFLFTSCLQDYWRRRAQQRHNEQAAAQNQLASLLDGGLSMGELPPGVDLDALLSGLDPSVAEALGLNRYGSWVIQFVLGANDLA
jgi:hypothetical protein